MTTIHTTARVGRDGNVIVPVGAEEAGQEVDITISPLRPRISAEEYQKTLRGVAGSIDDPTFERPPQWELDERESLE